MKSISKYQQFFSVHQEQIHHCTTFNKIYQNRATILIAMINLISTIFIALGIAFISFTEVLIKEGITIICYTLIINFTSVALINKSNISRRIKKIVNYFKNI
jgi:hypothetical protein